VRRAPRRYVLALVALLAPGAAFAASGDASAQGVRFVSAGRAYQGKPYSVRIAAKAGASCTLSVRYADGAAQSGLGSKQATSGSATWTWTLPAVAAPGPARLGARCGAGSAKRTITVVGTLIPPKISVVKSGWSVRQRTIGSSVSYGVVLKNQSPNADALNVSVQVNFKLADNKLIGTATQPIAAIGAGSTYNHAGSLQFPGAAPIADLELVILVGSRAKAQRLREPAVDNVAAVPQTFDPAWTAWVQGEVINGHTSLALRSVQLSAILFDARGNVLGGATGGAYNLLPPGTRQVFTISIGADSVPFDRIASVAVSRVPTYESIAP
jgi:hypothetical protein